MDQLSTITAAIVQSTAIAWARVALSQFLALLLWAGDLAPVPRFLIHKVECFSENDHKDSMKLL